MTTSDSPFVSVIIPLFDDARIRSCLETLLTQTHPSYELLVVDNGSAEDFITKLSQEFPTVTFLTEPIAGSYAARNTGIRHAKGTVLAFTDADCIPSQDWIAQGVSALFSKENVGLVGGAITFFSEKNPNGSLSIIEKYDARSNLKQQNFIDDQHFAATANVFYKKSVIDAVGPFNQEIKSGGDADLGRRIFSAGYKLIYSETASVKHPARHSLSSVITRARRIAGGNYQRFYSKLTLFSFFQKLFRKIFLVEKKNVESIYKNDYTLLERLGILSVIIFLKMVTILEILRLKFGGVPERR